MITLGAHLRSRRSAALVAGLLCCPAVFGQAWVPPKGEGNVSLTFQHRKATEQLFTNGIEGDIGALRAGNAFLTFDYAIMDRLAVSVGVVYINSKYNGSGGHGPLDDGEFHGSFQDVSVGLRYAVPFKAVTITPAVGFGAPLNAYETAGFNAVGRDLQQYTVGAAIGWVPRRSRPKVHFEGGYRYVFVEEALGVDTDRQVVEAEVGYSFTRRLTGLAQVYRQTSTGGVDLLELGGLPPQIQRNHDRILALEEDRAGLGLGFRIGQSLNLVALYSDTLDGENIEASRSFTLSVGWSFGDKPKQLLMTP